MGTVGACYDNAMMDSFRGRDATRTKRHKEWLTRDELTNAIVEWIECCYNPKRRHSSIGMHSLVTFEILHTRARPRSVSVVAVLLGGGPPGSAPVTRRDSTKIWPLRRALFVTCPSWLPAPAWPTSWLDLTPHARCPC
jgi:hypothetical protein